MTTPALVRLLQSYPAVGSSNGSQRNWLAFLLFLRVPKTTLSLNDLLEKLTELRKVLIFTVMAYYSKRIQTKIIKGKRYTGQIQDRPGASFQLSSPSEVMWLVLNSPSNDVWKYALSIASQRAHMSLGVQGFYWGLITKVCSTHMADLNYSVSSPSRGQTDIIWPKIPTMNHIASIDYLA